MKDRLVQVSISRGVLRVSLRPRSPRDEGNEWSIELPIKTVQDLATKLTVGVLGALVLLLARLVVELMRR